MGYSNQIKKVLIVRFSSIGDIVLTSPVVRCIKLQLDCEIHFITKKKFLSVVNHNPHIDKLYSIDKEVTEVIPQLKKEKYDLIIDLHKNLRSKRLALSLGVKSISFDKINVEKWMMVHLRINRLPKKHLVDRYFEGIKDLGVVDDGEGLEYHHGLTKERINALVPNKDFIVISLGATYYTKRIPTEKIELAIRSIDKPILLLGGPDVKSEGLALSNKYQHITNLAGKTDLNESAAIISKCKFLISGDTGMMHIGAAFKKPILMFWGSTHISLGMYPFYGNNHKDLAIHMLNTEINCNPCSKIGKEKCPKGHFRCMMDWTKREIEHGVLTIDSI